MLHSSISFREHMDRDRYDRHNRRRDRHRDKDDKYKDRDRSRRDWSEPRSEINTPRFKDEPQTPNIKLRDDASKSAWDDEEEIPSKKSTWDFPTPSLHKTSSDWSERSSKSRAPNDSERSVNKSHGERKGKYEDDTPRPTPAYKFNNWADNRKRTGATPSARKEEGQLKWESTVDRQMWEEEQRRIDREWYNMDEGYSDENNPFSSVNEDYIKKKEEQLEQRKKKRISAQQRQINKDYELWERNRMLTSGVVHSVDFNEDFDEESVDRVHLLVHNIVPPFLDGRIVFTKQPEPVIPVR